MSCAEIKPKLELMADDELNSEQAATVLSHLDVCSACNEQWYAILHLRQAIKERAASFRPSADFESRLLKAVQAEAQISANAVEQDALLNREKRSKAVADLKGSVSWKIAASLLIVGAAVVTLIRLTGNNQIISSSSPSLLNDATIRPVKITPPPETVQSRQVVAAASLDDAMKNFDAYLQGSARATAGAANSSEIAGLSERAGFKIKTMALEGFKLSSAQIVSTASGKAQLVRLCYSRVKGKKNGANGKNDSIICYQAAGGKLIADGLNEHFIDGRKICCGEKQDRSIVFIPGQKTKPTVYSPEILLLSNISKSDLMDLVLSSS
ncbi:MAG: hypothetical protein KGS72_28975 [Cyanobacteria bacterium REEB67]|nr:hypothetical protein [Cyanobacteria bacterium REEB67]